MEDQNPESARAGTASPSFEQFIAEQNSLFSEEHQRRQVRAVPQAKTMQRPTNYGLIAMIIGAVFCAAFLIYLLTTL